VLYSEVEYLIVKISFIFVPATHRPPLPASQWKTGLFSSLYQTKKYFLVAAEKLTIQILNIL